MITWGASTKLAIVKINISKNNQKLERTEEYDILNAKLRNIAKNR